MLGEFWARNPVVILVDVETGANVSAEDGTVLGEEGDCVSGIVHCRI